MTNDNTDCTCHYCTGLLLSTTVLLINALDIPEDKARLASQIAIAWATNESESLSATDYLVMLRDHGAEFDMHTAQTLIPELD